MGLYFLGWMRWLGSVGRVEAVCSLLLQGTRPRFASDTLMSRRNIPASPLLPSPRRAGGIVGADARCGTNRGTLGLGRLCGNAEGDAEGRYRRQLAQNEDWAQGAYPQVCACTAQLYLPEATSGCPSSARAGPLQERRKCIARQAHASKRLKDVQLTTQLC